MTTLTQTDASELFRQPPERYLDVGVGEIAYRRIGTGPDVLLVHGWPVDGATYRKLVPHLAEHVTCHVIDLVGAGSSRFDDPQALSIDTHIAGVRATIDQLGLTDVSVVGQDSGGLVARHALAGDPRVRSFGLIGTEQPQGLSLRFKMFLVMRNLPKFGRILSWVSGQRRLRRNKFLFGDVFRDNSLLDGEFEEFFLDSLQANRSLLDATIAILKSFSIDDVHALADLHSKIDVPVKMVWGEHDRFFPRRWAQEMVDTFANASLDIIDDAGLFAHEERPAEVARALLPTLIG